VLALEALSNIDFLCRHCFEEKDENSSLPLFLAEMIYDSCAEVRLCTWKLLQNTDPTSFPSKLFLKIIQTGVEDTMTEIKFLAKTMCK